MFAFANKDGGMGACKTIRGKKKREKKKQNWDWILKRKEKNELKKKLTKEKKKFTLARGKKSEQKHSRKYNLKLWCGLIYLHGLVCDKLNLLVCLQNRCRLYFFSCIGPDWQWCCSDNYVRRCFQKDS